MNFSGVNQFMEAATDEKIEWREAIGDRKGEQQMKNLIMAIGGALLLIVSAPPTEEVAIVFAGDLRGAFAGCDCEVPGGLARRATAWEGIRQKASARGASVFTVDLGNLLGSALSDQPEVAVDVLTHLSDWGCNVLLLGPEDGSLDAAEVTGLCEASGLDLLVSDEILSTEIALDDGNMLTLYGLPNTMLTSGHEHVLESAMAGDPPGPQVLVSSLSQSGLLPLKGLLNAMDAVICRADDGPTRREDGGPWVLFGGSGDVGALWLSVDEEGGVASQVLEVIALGATVPGHPVAMAFVESLESPLDSEPPIPAPSGPAALVIEAVGLEWGEVVKGEVVMGYLQLTNPGAEPLRVRSISTTCRCIEVGECPDVILPGESATVEVEIHTQTREGNVRDHVIITSRDRAQPIQRIPVRGRVITEDSQ